eukprot:scaffold205976_cov15-Prasinocladus_malaysianus.AAC.1
MLASAELVCLAHRPPSPTPWPICTTSLPQKAEFNKPTANRRAVFVFNSILLKPSRPACAIQMQHRLVDQPISPLIFPAALKAAFKAAAV